MLPFPFKRFICGHFCSSRSLVLITFIIVNKYFSTGEILSNTSEAADDNFDYVVTAEQWNRVLDAIKNQNEDQLKSQLQNVDEVVQKRKLVHLFILMTCL